MKKLHEVLWEEIDGSIFTAEEFEVKLESGRRVKTRLSVDRRKIFNAIAHFVSQ